MAEAQRTDHAQQLRRALLAIEKAEARADKLEAARREPIAVVGLGCRFPRATTPSEFWDNLVGGVDCIREVPADRWDVDALFDPDPDAPGKMITRWGGFVDGPDQFDPAFFGIAPREAERMDPQQRIALEVAWEALEDAGLVAAELAGTAVGVFMGACISDYAHHLAADLTAIDAHSATGVALSIIANRISYLLNFKGPSMAVDTACSSSLVAIHLACQSLRAGECNVALAGGVNTILKPHLTVFFSRARAMARDGRCKAFDARADGFVRGEGGGVVVLKRASDARAAGDRVLALVRGSAVNQDGTTSGMTAPNGLSQQAVIRRALDAAGVAPGRVGYVEAHGTGTALGDPIEAEALARVLGDPGEAGTCWVGAVKTNIGHLEAGAGVAGFIKAVLALHHGVIPPNLHFQRLNPEISVAGTRLQFPIRPVAWRDAGRVAGVSSFGFGGTNAHVVLEAVDPGTTADPPPPAPAMLVLPLSARSEAALGHAAQRLSAHLAAHPELALADVCTTAAVGRSQFRHRAAFQADTAGEMRAALAAFASGAPAGGVAGPAVAAPRPRVAFLFTGQGAQYAGMGRVLYDGSAVFRAAIDECAAGLSPHLDLPLAAILFPAPGAERLIDETAYTQPALFALEYALVQLWRSWGVTPDVVIGHNLGELVAACVAGVFRLDDALALVAARGQLVQIHARRGAMAAVRATEAEMIERIAPLGGALAIAAVNAPESVVIAGGEDAVAGLIEQMTAERREARRLPGANAFHSSLIEPALDAFEARVAQVKLSPPSLVMISNLSGARAGAEVATASYWRQQLRAPVRFRDGIEAVTAAGATVLVELGPHAALLGLAAETLGAGGQALVASLRRHRDDRAQIAEALGQVWVHGVAVDWAAVHRAAPGRRVPLPTAPFERQRYWHPRRSTPGSWPPAGGEPRGEGERSGRRGPPEHPQPDASWFHALAWRRSERRAPRAGPAIGRWLLCADRGGVAAALARLLEERGATCVQIAPGEEAALDVTGGFCGAVHLGGLDGVDPPTGGELRAAQARGTLSALALVQRIAELSPAPRLWIATRGAQALPADRAPVALAHAPLWGLGRVIALEHPELWGGLVDLDPVPAPQDARARGTAAALLHEISQPDREPQVAYRGGERHVARLVRWAAIAAGEPSPRPLALRADRSYLIAGGLGGLGLAVAQWMIPRGARHLALLGRRPAEGSRRDALRALEAAGARVLFVRADLECADEVAAAIDETARSMPPLAGVIHAAGVVDDGVLVRQDAARFAGAMASKLTGGWNLHAATLGQPLDFFALFSSAAALLGSAGQGSYAAANAFLDALAHHRRTLGLPAISIAWGPWSEVGVWAALGARARASRGVSPIPPARGVEALAELLAGAPAHVAVLPIDWRAFSEQIAAPVPAFLTELVREPGREGTAGREGDELRARLAAATADQRTAVLAAFLVERVAAAMRSDPEQLPHDRNLVELGIDSLMVMEVAGHIKRELGLALYPREVYEHPSIAALSGYLAAELARAVGTDTHGAVAADRTAPVTVAEADAPPAPAVRRAVVPDHRIPGVAFILSSPRAGSTLLRVMLAGHPAVFCPPELHLLGFETMAERERALGASYLGEGLHRAIMEIERLDADGARRQLERWIDDDLPVQAVYAWLQARIGGRWLVDKSPSYAGNPATLERAEQLFDGARYLFLFRHPHAVIESFVRKRMHKLLGGDRADPHALAEQVWADWNDHTLAFLARIPAERAYRLRYEELVRDPERAMRRVCEFLRVPYDAAVLSPYAGGRMTDGVHPQSAAIGDPGFLEHTGIDDRLADRRRDQRLARPLGEAARRVAAELDYELPRDDAVARGPAMVAGSPRESFVDVRGLRLCMLSWGPERGPLVVCLHGILDHAGAMAEVAQRLAHRGMRVIAPDLRGHGRSGHVGAGGSYHLVDFVADVDALARALGPAPFTLVGHSLGAAIAGLFAGVRPERVPSLVLVEPALPSGASAGGSAGGSVGDGPDRLSIHLDHLAMVRPHTVFRIVEAAAEQLRAAVAMSPAQALASARRLTIACEGGVQWCWDPLLRTRAGVAFHALELPPERFRALLGHVRCPVTWVYGDRSELRHLARLEIGAGGSHEAVIPGGHNLHLDSPAELAELIADAARSPARSWR